MMRAYTDLLVSICHRRGAFTMGGMVAFIPEPARSRTQQPGTCPAAATAEISRAQVWQWVHNQVTLTTGETVTPELVS